MVSSRYYLNLVLVDEEDRRYFKQQEITLWRKEVTLSTVICPQRSPNHFGIRSFKHDGELLLPDRVAAPAVGWERLDAGGGAAVDRARASRLCVCVCVGFAPPLAGCGQETGAPRAIRVNRELLRGRSWNSCGFSRLIPPQRPESVHARRRRRRRRWCRRLFLD